MSEVATWVAREVQHRRAMELLGRLTAACEGHDRSVVLEAAATLTAQTIAACSDTREAAQAMVREAAAVMAADALAKWKGA